MHLVRPVAPHPQTLDLDIRIARTRHELAAVLEIRRRVFDDEQGMTDAGVVTAEDERSLHALAVIPAGAIGTGRLTLGFGFQGEAQIAWVATLPGYRGQGVGRAIMRHLLAIADQERAPAVILSAQTHAAGFYRSLGFVPYGDRFAVHGIEHQMMSRQRPG